jgi:hypothetical protein
MPVVEKKNILHVNIPAIVCMVRGFPYFTLLGLEEGLMRDV